jgi:uncharacterized phage protein gp47/JayE
LPSRTVFDGTLGAVANLPGVTRLRGYENDASQTDTNGIPPHSLSLVVEGGDPQKIGEAIAIKKTPGCGTYGSTTINTYDQWGVPNPIKFFRPDIKNVAVAISINPLAGYLAVTGEAIRQWVADYINALAIGESVLISKLYTPINAAEPDPLLRSFDVLSLCELSRNLRFFVTQLENRISKKNPNFPC